MPASDHPVFQAPANPQVKIWRYLDFTKFVSMLENKGLFFSRADQLGDPFEGSRPKMNVANAKAQHEASYAKFEELTGKKIDFGGKTPFEMDVEFNRNLAKVMDISCWHMNADESAGMWKYYTQTNESIAICSTYQKLKDCLDDRCFIGVVTYIDYASASIPAGNLFWQFLHKRKSFAHENELRAIDGDFMLSQLEERKSGGTWKYLDLNALIDEIRVAPTSPPWFKELVEQVAKRFGLAKPLKQSSLDDAPFG